MKASVTWISCLIKNMTCGCINPGLKNIENVPPTIVGGTFSLWLFGCYQVCSVSCTAFLKVIHDRKFAKAGSVFIPGAAAFI